MARYCAAVRIISLLPSATEIVSVLGLDQAKVEELCGRARTAGTIEVANLLCPGNIVVSGSKAACDDTFSASLTCPTSMRKSMRAQPFPAAGPPIFICWPIWWQKREWIWACPNNWRRISPGKRLLARPLSAGKNSPRCKRFIGMWR